MWLKVSVSIPVDFRSVTIHLATEDEDIGLWGFTKERSTFSFPSLLKDSVLGTYASFVHSFYQYSMMEKWMMEKWMVLGWTRLFWLTYWTPSRSTFIAFRLRLDRSLDLEGLARASNTTSLNDNNFSDKDLLSPNSAMQEVTVDTSQVAEYLGKVGLLL